MKKLIFTTLILGLFTACNIDDVESDLTLVSGEEVNVAELTAVCTPDPNNPPLILGSEFRRTSYILETAVDANEDGIFSYDLKDEGLCEADPLRFQNDFTVWNAESSFVSLIVNGTNQEIYCNHADGTFPVYIQTGNNVDFCFNGEIKFSGTLSENETILTISLPYESLYGLFLAGGGNQILRADGTIEAYQGGAILVYERQ